MQNILSVLYWAILSRSPKNTSLFKIKTNAKFQFKKHFAGYVPLVSQSPYPIIVYFLPSYRPHLSHLLENVIFTIPT